VSSKPLNIKGEKGAKVEIECKENIFAGVCFVYKFAVSILYPGKASIGFFKKKKNIIEHIGTSCHSRTCFDFWLNKMIKMYYII